MPNLSSSATYRLAIAMIAMVVLGVIAASCGSEVPIGGIGSPTAPAGSDPTPSAGVSTTPSPLPSGTAPSPVAIAAPLTSDGARQAAQQFLDAWGRGEFTAMYGMLSTESKASITGDRFVGRYEAITSGIVITQVVAKAGQPELFPSTASPNKATVPFNVEMQSARVGRLDEVNIMTLVSDGGQWRVAWTPELIFRDLTGANVVRIDSDDPTRGPILDRKGRMLAGAGSVASVGLIPGNVKDEGKALQALGDLLGMPQDAIKATYANAKPDWWVPLRDLPDSRRAEAVAKLGGIAGVEVRSKDARVYPLGPVAAHAVGYVAPVTADDLKTFGPQGYEEGDSIGRAGIEAWAENELAGDKGGKLYIADQDGDTVRVIAQRKAQPGAPVQLTIDLDLQEAADQALGAKTGSIVALDPRDNSVVAMVSHPSFDPNSFVTGMTDAEWQKLSNDPRKPFQSRATSSAYPTGSIFKVITMSAGLEKGGFKPDTPFECDGVWTGLQGVTMGDWLPGGHGKLNLQEGLTQSCNIVFYELGKKLDSIDASLLPNFAKQFGLGQPTGLIGLEEVPGIVPDPAWKQKTLKQAWFPGDSVNLAIGQGYLEATPLQMANAYASLANGGELRNPVLVRKVGDGDQAKTFATQTRSRLQVSGATLASIRAGMKDVASTPKGTAFYAFNGFTVPTAAKTGSAENQNPDAHAWFAGYAPADAPQIVVIVMVEGGRAGGDVAAPLARKVMEVYFGKR